MSASTALFLPSLFRAPLGTSGTKPTSSDIPTFGKDRTDGTYLGDGSLFTRLLACVSRNASQYEPLDRAYSPCKRPHTSHRHPDFFLLEVGIHALEALVTLYGYASEDNAAAQQAPYCVNSTRSLASELRSPRPH